MSGDIEIELDIERQETLFLLIKCFIESSVVRRPKIDSAIARIEKMLELCVRDEQYLSVLEVWYIRQAGEDLTKEGEIRFNLDWDTFRMEIKAGKDKFPISQDDVLGSISPLYRKLANEVRIRCIRDGVNDLRWSINYAQEVYSDRELHREINKQLGLVTGDNKEMTKLDNVFRKHPRERIKVKASDVGDVQSSVVWKVQK